MSVILLSMSIHTFISYTVTSKSVWVMLGCMMVTVGMYLCSQGPHSLIRQCDSSIQPPLLPRSSLGKSALQSLWLVPVSSVYSSGVRLVSVLSAPHNVHCVPDCYVTIRGFISQTSGGVPVYWGTESMNASVSFYMAVHMKNRGAADWLNYWGHQQTPLDVTVPITKGNRDFTSQDLRAPIHFHHWWELTQLIDRFII